MYFKYIRLAPLSMLLGTYLALISNHSGEMSLRAFDFRQVNRFYLHDCYRAAPAPLKVRSAAFGTLNDGRIIMCGGISATYVCTRND